MTEPICPDPAIRPRRSMSQPLPVLLALALLLAACSGGDDEGSDTLAYTESTGTTIAEAEADGSAEEDPDDDEPGPTTTAEQGLEGTAPTTEGSGLPPVTTVPGGPTGDVENIYRGILGDLFLDQELVEPVADPPVPVDGVAPLTGLPGAVPDRPAAVVKVGNGSAALPQSGLDSADLVYEAEVEGGATRLAAVYHSTSAVVGPVRSGRTTDVGVLGPFGRPLFLYSGANVVTDGIIRSQSQVQNRSFATSSGYWRDDGRQAPSNVLTDTAPHWASAEGGSPPPQFFYRDGASEQGAPDESLTIDYGATDVRWEWDGSRWRRWQNGAEHVTVDGAQLAVANVVVIEVLSVDTGMVDASGGTVPEMVYVGSGPLTVHTDGRAITGTWTKSSLESPPTLLDADGEAIALTPGRTWIQLVQASTAVS